jgi:hypothetical protein
MTGALRARDSGLSYVSVEECLHELDSPLLRRSSMACSLTRSSPSRACITAIRVRADRRPHHSYERPAGLFSPATTSLRSRTAHCRSKPQSLSLGTPHRCDGGVCRPDEIECEGDRLVG